MFSILNIKINKKVINSRTVKDVKLQPNKLNFELNWVFLKNKNSELRILTNKIFKNDGIF